MASLNHTQFKVEKSLKELQEAEESYNRLLDQCQSLDTALLELGGIIAWLLREKSYQLDGKKDCHLLTSSKERRLLRYEVLPHNIREEESNKKQKATTNKSGLHLRLTAIYSLPGGWSLDVHLKSRIHVDKHTRHTFSLPALEPNDTWDRIIPVDFIWTPAPLEVQLQLTRWMEHGQSVSLPVAIVNMDLLRFASANIYYKIESDNDDLIEMADQTLDLKGQFKRLTNKPSQHVLSSLDRHYVIPISLQRLAEQLSRYKIMVDGRAYSIDQVYRMLLALLLGEYLPERQLSTIIQSAHYAECYFPNSKAAVSLTLSRDDVNTQDQAALAIYSMDALMSNTICHALKQRLATLLA